MSKLIEKFETNQCMVYVIDPEIELFNEKLYCVISIHKKNLSQNTRFGNKTQLDSMINSYKRIGEFKL